MDTKNKNVQNAPSKIPPSNIKLGLWITQKTHKVAGVPHICKFLDYFPFYQLPHFFI